MTLKYILRMLFRMLVLIFCCFLGAGIMYGIMTQYIKVVPVDRTATLNIIVTTNGPVSFQLGNVFCNTIQIDPQTMTATGQSATDLVDGRDYHFHAILDWLGDPQASTLHADICYLYAGQ